MSKYTAEDITMSPAVEEVINRQIRRINYVYAEGEWTPEDVQKAVNDIHADLITLMNLHGGEDLLIEVVGEDHAKKITQQSVADLFPAED